MENHTVYEKAALKLIGIVMVGMLINKNPEELTKEAAAILEKDFIPKPE
jgi:hypothetical protein